MFSLVVVSFLVAFLCLSCRHFQVLYYFNFWVCAALISFCLCLTAHLSGPVCWWGQQSRWWSWSQFPRCFTHLSKHLWNLTSSTYPVDCVCVCVCAHAHACMCTLSLFWLCFGSLLCNGLCAPIREVTLLLLLCLMTIFAGAEWQGAVLLYASLRAWNRVAPHARVRLRLCGRGGRQRVQLQHSSQWGLYSLFDYIFLKIQTRKRFKRTLFIRIKHIMHIFPGNPLYQAKNDT